MHVELLQVLRTLPCSVMLSGYPFALYDDELLPDWRTIELQVMNQGGVQTEKLPFNFTPDGYIGQATQEKNLVNLLVTQMISFKQTQKMLQVLIGQLLSEATIMKIVMKLHHALEEWEQTSIEKLLQMPTIHADETSSRVDRNVDWR